MCVCDYCDGKGKKGGGGVLKIPMIFYLGEILLFIPKRRMCSGDLAYESEHTM